MKEADTNKMVDRIDSNVYVATVLEEFAIYRYVENVN